jgi:hypothetical protein
MSAFGTAVKPRSTVIVRRTTDLSKAAAFLAREAPRREFTRSLPGSHELLRWGPGNR